MPASGPFSWLWGPATASVLWRVVKQTAAKTVGYPALDTDHITGVVEQEGVAQGSPVSIWTLRGVPVKVQVSAAVAANAFICPDGTAADGRVKTATTGDRVCGETITEATAANDIIWAYLFDGPTL